MKNQPSAIWGSEREKDGYYWGFFLYEREKKIKEVIAKEQKRKKKGIR